MKFLKFSYTIFSWSVSIHKKKNEHKVISSICCLMVSLAYRKLLDTTCCSLQGPPLRGARSFDAAQTLNALYMPNRMKRKEGRLMLKRFIRWILPLMVLVLIATYFVLSPIVASYAAGPMTASHITAPHAQMPHRRWRP